MENNNKNIQELIKAEEEVMTMVGHIVWSFEDTCSSSIFTEFYRPLNHHRPGRADTTNPQLHDDESDEHCVEDANKILTRYYEQTMLKVSEFTQTILYSILFYKWAESRNDGTVSSPPTNWRDSLPNHLRRATQQKANRIISSLMGITRLRLEALGHVYDALHVAERLAIGYIQRRGDLVVDPSIGANERQATLNRLEDDAVNYVNRQIN